MKKIILEKAYEDETHILEAKLPCLISTIRTMNEPRLMNAFDIWETYDREINMITCDNLDIDQKDIGLTGSPTRVKKTYTKPVMQKISKRST